VAVMDGSKPESETQVWEVPEIWHQFARRNATWLIQGAHRLVVDKVAAMRAATGADSCYIWPSLIGTAQPP
jgi:hypothetical protein